MCPVAPGPIAASPRPSPDAPRTRLSYPRHGTGTIACGRPTAAIAPGTAGALNPDAIAVRCPSFHRIPPSDLGDRILKVTSANQFVQRRLSGGDLRINTCVYCTYLSQQYLSEVLKYPKGMARQISELYMSFETSGKQVSL